MKFVGMPKKPDLSDEDQAMRERLGGALRQASSARGIKPQDMASAGGVSLAHQYRIEAGERTPDVLYLFKVCRLMGIAMDSLFQAGAASGMPSDSAPRKMVNKAAGSVQVGHQTGGSNQVINKGKKVRE